MEFFNFLSNDGVTISIPLEAALSLFEIVKGYYELYGNIPMSVPYSAKVIYHAFFQYNESIPRIEYVRLRLESYMFLHFLKLSLQISPYFSKKNILNGNVSLDEILEKITQLFWYLEVDNLENIKPFPRLTKHLFVACIQGLDNNESIRGVELLKFYTLLFENNLDHVEFLDEIYFAFICRHYCEGFLWEQLFKDDPRWTDALQATTIGIFHEHFKKGILDRLCMDIVNNHQWFFEEILSRCHSCKKFKAEFQEVGSNLLYCSKNCQIRNKEKTL